MTGWSDLDRAATEDEAPPSVSPSDETDLEGTGPVLPDTDGTTGDEATTTGTADSDERGRESVRATPAERTNAGSKVDGTTEPTRSVDRADEPLLEQAVSSDRWLVALTVALLAVGVGVLARDAAIFLSSVVALSYVGYSYATRPPEPTLTVERTLEPASPTPGDTVGVSVTVGNAGSASIPDVRVVDEPPSDLHLEGEPRVAGSIAPGESLTLEYTVSAKRGEHTFGDVTISARNASASERVVARYRLSSEFTCDDALERMPLAGQTTQLTGRVETDVGGEGIEFYSIRPFHPTDPMRRVDWNRLARSGELTTIEFREERAASVTVVVDARASNTVVRRPGELDARSLSYHATEWLVTALLGENNRVGVALYGDRGDYLLPRSGRDQLARATRLLDGDWCGSFGRRSWLAHGDRSVDRFCRHLNDEKQLLFVTPLLDEDPVTSAQRFRAYGHEVTLVCPLVADRAGYEGVLDRADVEARCSSLRSHGVRVVEWSPDESLHVAVDRSKRRWSR
ncbi:DUF58 domain-containing protein [Natrialbaceae archaeon A-CW3]